MIINYSNNVYDYYYSDKILVDELLHDIVNGAGVDIPANGNPCESSIFAISGEESSLPVFLYNIKYLKA